MSAYFDRKKKKYVVSGKEFEERPSTIDFVKEAFEDSNTKAQLEALRKRKEAARG